MNLRFAGDPRAETRRQGAVLVLFALLTFVFFAIAAVVIDVGLANLTQAQMQVAADTAAIEGCRLRNFDELLGDSNTQKRMRAAGMVRLNFDDDLHPTQGGYAPDDSSGSQSVDDADAAGVMAGPGLAVTGGTGAWAANGVLGYQPDSELARLDDPRLQENRQLNLRHGDIVAGRFLEGRPARETAAYERDDFLPAAVGNPSLNSLSLLVRLRRSGSENPQDSQAGVSSSLPTLPVVFGLGSTILQAPGEDWDPRRDGLTVRATAIASARPAMRIGRSPCDEAGNPLYDHEPDTLGAPDRQRISGLMPFYITRDAWVRHFRDEGWQASSTSTPGKVEVRADGSIHLVTATPEFSTEVAVGHFLFDAASQPTNPCDAEVGWPEIVGRSVPSATSAPVRGFRYTSRKPAYVAIVELIPDSTGVLKLRVVGYGFAHVWPVGAVANEMTPPFNGTGQFVISAGEGITYGPLRCWVAQDNASSILNSAADEVVGPVLSGAEWREVLRWSNQLAYGVDAPDPERIHDYAYIQRGTVLAPALTR